MHLSRSFHRSRKMSQHQIRRHQLSSNRCNPREIFLNQLWASWKKMNFPASSRTYVQLSIVYLECRNSKNTYCRLSCNFCRLWSSKPGCFYETFSECFRSLEHELRLSSSCPSSRNNSCNDHIFWNYRFVDVNLLPLCQHLWYRLRGRIFSTS